MSSTGLTYGRAGAAKADRARAGKDRRQKLILAGVGGLLLLVVAVQLPSLFGSDAPVETAAPPAVAVPVPVPADVAPAPITAAETRAQIDRLQRDFIAKDPFAGRPVNAGSDTVGVRSGPSGTRDPFAQRAGSAGAGAVPVVEVAGVRDPFTPREAPAPVAPVAPTPPVATPPPVTGPRLRGYTIILASIPVRSGRSAAVQAGAAARARGVPDVAVLRSSDYATLRPGYFAVYSRVFETRTEAQRALNSTRNRGYPKAYVRPLGR